MQLGFKTAIFGLVRLSRSHAMPTGDEVLLKPPKGKGAILTISYLLPRHRKSPADLMQRKRIKEILGLP